MAVFSNGDSIYKKFSGSNMDSDHKRPAPAKEKPLPYRQMQRKPAEAPLAPENDRHTHVSVHIAGMQYRLISPDKEGEAYVREIAGKADQLILQIQKNAPGMSMTSVTVLALVNAIDELHQKDVRISELEHEITKYSVAAETDKSNYMHLRETNWELKKEVLRLQAVIDEYENSAEDEFEPEEKKRDLLPLEELEYNVLEQESCDD